MLVFVRCAVLAVCARVCVWHVFAREPAASRAYRFPTTAVGLRTTPNSPHVFACGHAASPGAPMGGTHPKRGDPTGTELSSASDCVDRRGGTLTAGRYGELCPDKAGGQWTCRPDILEST